MRLAAAHLRTLGNKYYLDEKAESDYNKDIEKCAMPKKQAAGRRRQKTHSFSKGFAAFCR
jgi:hypothetical protein